MRLSVHQAATLAREVAMRLRTGVPLPEALEHCAGSFPSWGPCLREAAARLTAGAPVADVFSRMRSVPRPLSRILASGEAGEELPWALDEAACLLEEAEERRLRVGAVLAYPQTLTGVFLLLFAALNTLVLPGFVSLYQGLCLTLPLSTKILVILASPICQAGCAVLGALAWIAVNPVLCGRRGQALRLRLPVLGPWLRRQNMVTWLSWLGLLLRKGVPLDEAVRVAGGACPSLPFREALERVADRVGRGSQLSAALASERFCPEFGVWLVAQAESVDLAGPCLSRARDALRRDVDMTTDCVVGLLEPVAVTALGVVILVVMVSLFLPLYSYCGSMG